MVKRVWSKNGFRLDAQVEVLTVQTVVYALCENDFLVNQIDELIRQIKEAEMQDLSSVHAAAVWLKRERRGCYR